MRVVCIDVSVQWCSKVAVVLLFSIVTQVEKIGFVAELARTRTHLSHIVYTVLKAACTAGVPYSSQ